MRKEVQYQDDSGFLGLALDPNFATNGYIYLAYPVNPDSDGLAHQPYTFGRVVRYTASAGNHNVADLTTRKVLIGNTYADGIPLPYYSHTLDCLRFGNDGTLFITCGDGGHPDYTDAGGHDAAAFGSSKIADSLDIGSYRAQDLDCYDGKLLRVDPATGYGLRSNPFYDGDSTHVRSRVWSYGLRNPYRFSVKPGTGSPDPAAGSPGDIFISNTGWNTWEDVNFTRTGGENFGWPCYEGPYIQSNYQSSSPSSYGCSTIGTPANPKTWTAPFYYYGHQDSPVSDTDAVLGSALTGAANYSGASYPADYLGSFFFCDIDGWIKALQYSGDSVVSVSPFADNLPEPVDLESDPVTGDIYYADILSSQVRRFVYVGNLNPPVTKGTAEPVMGPAPLAVSFTGGSSYDPHGSHISYSWNFGDGDSSSLANPHHIYETEGTYFVTLRVTNLAGSIDSTQFCINVGDFPKGYDVTNPANIQATNISNANPDVGLLDDNIFATPAGPPLVQQYVTQHFQGGATDSLGYTYASQKTFNGLVLQQGVVSSIFGGYFQSFNIQVRQGGVWTTVSGLQTSPTYAGASAPNYQTYVFIFAPVTGNGIRIIGPPHADGFDVDAVELRALSPYGGGTFALESPSSNDTLSELSTTQFSWSRSLPVDTLSPVTYSLHLTGVGHDTVYDGISDTTFPVPMLDFGSAYSWYVVAHNGASTTNSLDTVHFVTSPFELAVSDGWNLLSLPLIPIAAEKTAVFPTAVSNAFAYNAGYVTAPTLQPGIAYWLKFNGPQAAPLAGSWLTNDTVSVARGWNMLGGTTDSVSVDLIDLEPDSIVQSAYFTYSNGYNVTSVLAPGQGYWVKTSDAGRLIFGAGSRSSPGAILKGISRIIPGETPPRGFSTLMIGPAQSAGGRSAQQTKLFFTDQTTAANLAMYELPPPPPAGAFDARFTSGRSAEVIPPAASGGELPLQIASVSSSVAITAQFTAGVSRQYFVVERNGERIVKKYRLENNRKTFVAVNPKSAYALRSEDLPLTYKLYQNYPNPFNPTTMIEFDLPERSVVNLSVYNILGQRVALLAANRSMESGTQTIAFDGAAYASGVYLYRLDAVSEDPSSGAKYSETRKMLLIK